MTFFDTHVHFDGLENPADVISRAEKDGVRKMIAIGVNPETDIFAVNTAKQFPQIIKSAIGCDRNQARVLGSTIEINSAINMLKSMIAEHKDCMCAIGEIGLDFHHDSDTAETQVTLFAEQLKLARELKMPVIVHSREAETATLSALQKHRNELSKTAERIGVIHCFTGSKKFARDLIDLGFHISFSGIITFDNAPHLRDVVRAVPDNRLLIETDSPYLAPVPHRGKQNEPAYVRYVAEKIAEIKGMTPEEIAALTTKNASLLFRF